MSQESYGSYVLSVAQKKRLAEERKKREAEERRLREEARRREIELRQQKEIKAQKERIAVTEHFRKIASGLQKRESSQTPFTGAQNIDDRIKLAEQIKEITGSRYFFKRMADSQIYCQYSSDFCF